MLHERRHDREFVESIETIRRQLVRAKDRVLVRHPGARIRWVLETSTWVVIDPETREALDSAQSLDELASANRAGNPQPASGTHLRLDDGVQDTDE
jgi:hypothetical protein